MRRILAAFLLPWLVLIGSAGAKVPAAVDPLLETQPRKERPGTIAIVASGPRAGEAVFRALEAAEKIATGSIHGTAHMYVITNDGEVRTFDNFGRGGTKTLFIRGEETGVDPPPEVAEARIAGIISTGPRRPNLKPYDGPHPWYENGVGFVTGHRMPDDVGRSGVPVDHEVLRLMKQGLTPRAAVDQVIGSNPRVDAGLIAVDVKGNIAMRNSQLVNERPDYGRARGVDQPTGAVVETILNEIHPPQAVAQLVVNKALETMSGAREADVEIRVRSGIKLERGQENLVEVNDEMEAVRISTKEERYLTGRHWAAIPYILSRVVRNGQTLGYTNLEMLARLDDGVIKSLSFQDSAPVPVRQSPRVCEFETPHLTVCRVP